MPLIRRVVGESMLPSLRPGRLVIGLKRRQPKIGDIVIAQQAGREVVKRIASHGSRGYFLLGDNPIASTDSRQHGWVDRTAVAAVVITRLSQ